MNYICYEYTFFETQGLLDLHKTFECGQCFRWNSVGQGNTEIYQGIIGKHLIRIEKQPKDFMPNYDTFKAKVISPMGYKLHLADLVDYLDLSTDYSLLEKANLTDFEKQAIKNGKGIRILRQDIWETTVSFIISQRNNIPKIKSTINKMCEKFGTFYKVNNSGYYQFPTPKQLVDAGIEGLQSVGLGYRAEYVYLIAKEFCENTDLILKRTIDKSGNEISLRLQQEKGIGPKVANCIALFGYHKLEMFPVDVWIQRMIDTKYNGYIDISRFGNLAGLMQQYMFYSMKGGE